MALAAAAAAAASVDGVAAAAAAAAVTLPGTESDVSSAVEAAAAHQARMLEQENDTARALGHTSETSCANTFLDCAERQARETSDPDGEDALTDCGARDHGQGTTRMSTEASESCRFCP